jgi:hypothetical protein
MKNDPIVIKHLKNTTSYLRAHFWKDNEVLLQDIGFLVSIVPPKLSKEYVAKRMLKYCDVYSIPCDMTWTGPMPLRSN